MWYQLDVSFDGKRALFAWKKGPNITDDDYHLYEMDLATKKSRQITSDKGVADYEARYLPSGDIIFASSRCTQTGKSLKLNDPEPRYLDAIAEREAKNPKK
jgi:Tol biopolymer transport system component